MKQFTAGSKKSNDNRQDKVDSLGKIKKRIRDTKRVLSKEATSAVLRVNFERRLKALEYELGEKMIDAKELKMKNKYHKVKHFEKKKVERKLKSAKNKAAEATTESEKKEAQEEVAKLELDSMYITHYPQTKPYVSLFPKENADDAHNMRMREEVRGKIQEILKNDGDFEEMHKSYRAQYREALVKAGEILEEKPLLLDEEKVAEPASEEENNTGRIRDEFFE
ncbi:hypothetical protein DFQ28_010820 [Apophysomyces sp. BC1034]|nr:hypothetical protein DFQ30_010567 [Apophysomyces sp. BC1015]KAG0170215.1 hypothetical protein DFQ29_009373 [Apophysomyces sp. BC1021]KAG0184625.1 hypothetical protein DFQ28_010820 [Apophysomyces sp. BC1034]